MISRVTISLVATAVLAACSSPQAERVERERRAATQFLERQGSIGDPGRVAAADFAFAKMAREEGLWTAFRAYAADDAVMDAPDGFAPVSELLAGVDDPPEPIRWAPTDVWSSCDGTLAVTLGRFLRPNGQVGDYVTVWELQGDNSYKYIYDTGTPDDPQPEPQADEELPANAIVVPGMISIEGRIADCPSEDNPTPPAQIETRGNADGYHYQSGVSRDLTFFWRTEHRPDGSREVRVTYARDGVWERVVELVIPAGE